MAAGSEIGRLCGKNFPNLLSCACAAHSQYSDTGSWDRWVYLQNDVPWWSDSSTDRPRSLWIYILCVSSAPACRPWRQKYSWFQSATTPSMNFPVFLALGVLLRCLLPFINEISGQPFVIARFSIIVDSISNILVCTLCEAKSKYR